MKSLEKKGRSVWLKLTCVLVANPPFDTSFVFLHTISIIFCELVHLGFADCGQHQRRCWFTLSHARSSISQVGPCVITSSVCVSDAWYIAGVSTETTADRCTRDPTVQIWTVHSLDPWHPSDLRPGALTTPQYLMLRVYAHDMCVCRSTEYICGSGKHGPSV